MDWLTKHKGWLVSAAAGIVAFLTPAVQAWLANPAHIKYAAAGAAGWAIFQKWSASPNVPKL